MNGPCQNCTIPTTATPIPIPTSKHDQYPIDRIKEWDHETCLRFLELSETTQKKLSICSSNRNATAGASRKKCIKQLRRLETDQMFNIAEICETLNWTLHLLKRVEMFEPIPYFQIQVADEFHANLSLLKNLVMSIVTAPKL
jgi:hypothetical protein